MDWRARLESVKAVGAAAQQKGARAADDVIEEHWPAIRTVLEEKVAPALRSAASNDEVIQYVATELHALLPLPLRLIIRPKRLTDWCLANRDKIISIAQPKSSTGGSS